MPQGYKVYIRHKRLDRFHANISFLYPLKTPEKKTSGFLTFPGVQEWNIDLRWVEELQRFFKNISRKFEDKWVKYKAPVCKEINDLPILFSTI